MNSVLHRRPSAAMVVSIVALVVAMSGTAIAASHLVSGDKLIKKHSLSGNRLRNHTITRTQVNLKKLGKVNSAKHADSATTATTATNAGNANTVGGQGASAFLPVSSRIGTNGIKTSSGSAGGTNTTLFVTGPFTVTMTCTTSGSGTALTLSGSSSEANSDINGQLVPTANTPTDLGTTTDVPATTGFDSKDDVNIDLEAPSGREALLVGADGVNSMGAACWANWAGIH